MASLVMDLEAYAGKINLTPDEGQRTLSQCRGLPPEVRDGLAFQERRQENRHAREMAKMAADQARAAATAAGWRNYLLKH